MFSWLVLAALLLAILFAINMGCSGTAPSFAPAYGSGILSHKKVALLFTLFVLIGAFSIGGRVAKTIGKGIVTQESINIEAVLIILFAACIALVIANIIKVPQSTSQATVLAVVGIGLFHGNLKFDIFLLILPMWLILPILSFILAYLLGRFAYQKVLSIFEKREWMLSVFTVGACCYVAFGIGSNNVANAVGPLVGADVIDSQLAILILAPCFGIGSLLIGERVLRTIGKDLTELDLTRASLICMVTGTLLVFASIMGIPQSLVQLNAMAILGVGLANGGKRNIHNGTLWKIAKVWAIAPIIALVISFSLLSIVMTI